MQFPGIGVCVYLEDSHQAHGKGYAPVIPLQWACTEADKPKEAQRIEDPSYKVLWCVALTGTHGGSRNEDIAESHALVGSMPPRPPGIQMLQTWLPPGMPLQAAGHNKRCFRSNFPAQPAKRQLMCHQFDAGRYRRLEKPMEARGTKTIFMPPFRCRMLSRAWRSRAALRPPLASASLKREAITATMAATCSVRSSHPQTSCTAILHTLELACWQRSSFFRDL